MLREDSGDKKTIFTKKVGPLIVVNQKFLISSSKMLVTIVSLYHVTLIHKTFNITCFHLKCQ